MIIVGLFSWWYGAGWRQQALAVRDNLLTVYDYFSIDLLLKTLFAPWRQIAAGKVRGNISMQMRAWFDRLFSRVIGGIIRTVVMIVGIVSLLAMTVVGLLRLFVWPLVPVLPIVFVFLTMTGWVPWRI